MELVLTEAQRMLKTSARAFLEKECTPDHAREMEADQRGYSPGIWKEMAKLGWIGWPFPEGFGGSSGNFFDLGLLVEELGYAATPTPFFSSIATAGMLVNEAGSLEQRRELLPKIASGELLLTLAYLEGDGELEESGISIEAQRSGNDFVISGTKRFVMDAHVSKQMICAVRTQCSDSPLQGLSLFIVDTQDPDISVRQMQTTSGDKQFEVELSKVRVSETSRLGPLHQAGEALGQVLLKATSLKCMEMIGGAEAVVDMTLEYVKGRVQFGRPIGSFQAVHHHCVDMYRDLLVSRMLAYQACWRVAENISPEEAVSAAKLKISRAYPAITRMAHQVTGAVGYYTEYPLELYTRRAMSASVSFGGPNTHARKLANMITAKEHTAHEL